MILGIDGNPQDSGTSGTILQEALEEARRAGSETLLISVKDYSVAACEACEECSKGEGCAIRDAMWDIYPLLAECRGLIIATPVFFAGPPAMLKAWIDRCNPFWKDRKILNRNLQPNRPGALIVTAGARRKTDFIGTLEPIRALFYTLGMGLDAQLLVGGLDYLEEPHPTENRRAEARRLGKKIADLQSTTDQTYQPDYPWWSGGRVTSDELELGSCGSE
ncbi:MAG: flavodoxin family protein [bacterium]